ncbi:Flagellin N-methylase [Serratia rubidaea]|uniref:Flagellin N-methylase n=1 Tax=Serratia rubidaea TaxID=61652 RepID=A0A447QV85_SERRU|nr:Flagellin N-methylase [Serratia rubidaea]
MSEILNPCVSCGACCAYFRVSFYWAEGDDGGGVVPSALTEPLTPFLRCMQGTNSKSPRCTALDGEIGRAVSCSIYLNRPTPCREFDASGETACVMRPATARANATACRRCPLPCRLRCRRR